VIASRFIIECLSLLHKLPDNRFSRRV